jgi:ArsR family transcriptional regulator, arsenate/arsenite/antimonite-responsive transcriptional repressor
MLVDAICCAPVLAAPLGEDEASALAEVFRALSDPVRLRILSLIATAEGREVCACDLVAVAGRSQPTVSHHLKVLREAGLVESEKRGAWVWYRAVPARLDQLRGALDTRRRTRA